MNHSQRGDDLFGSEDIMDDTRQSIEGACLVVADLTGKNANIFYEVGIAHSLDKPVLLLAQFMSDVPLDLRRKSRLGRPENPWRAYETGI